MDNLWANETDVQYMVYTLRTTAPMLIWRRLALQCAYRLAPMSDREQAVAEYLLDMENSLYNDTIYILRFRDFGKGLLAATLSNLSAVYAYRTLPPFHVRTFSSCAKYFGVSVADLIRCVAPWPSQLPLVLTPPSRTAIELAICALANQEWGTAGIVADELEDSGYRGEIVMQHLRQSFHCSHCWALNLVCNHKSLLVNDL